MELNELERLLRLHRRSRQKEVLVLIAVAALGLAVVAGVALIVWRAL